MTVWVLNFGWESDWGELPGSSLLLFLFLLENSWGEKNPNNPTNPTTMADLWNSEEKGEIWLSLLLWSLLILQRWRWQDPKLLLSCCWHLNCLIFSSAVFSSGIRSAGFFQMLCKTHLCAQADACLAAVLGVMAALRAHVNLHCSFAALI